MDISDSSGELLSFPVNSESASAIGAIHDAYSGAMVACAILNRDVDKHFLGRTVIRLCDRFALDPAPFYEGFSCFSVNDLGDPALRSFLESLVGNVVLNRVRTGKFSLNMADKVMLKALTSNPLRAVGTGTNLNIRGYVTNSSSNGDLILGIMREADPATAVMIASYVAKRAGSEDTYRRSAFRLRDGLDLRPVKFVSPDGVKLLSLGMINEGVRRASVGTDYISASKIICDGLTILLNFKRHLHGTAYLEEVRHAIDAMRGCNVNGIVSVSEVAEINMRTDFLYGQLLAHSQRDI